jgi:hypothetical protein
MDRNRSGAAVKWEIRAVSIDYDAGEFMTQDRAGTQCSWSHAQVQVRAAYPGTCDFENNLPPRWLRIRNRLDGQRSAYIVENRGSHVCASETKSV